MICSLVWRSPSGKVDRRLDSQEGCTKGLTMDVEEILTELKCNRGTFPRKALESAVANRDAMIPELLAVLERAAGNIEDLLAQPEYMLHIYAMFLLAQFREPLAYPLIAQFFSAPGEVVHDATGDVVTEDLPRILASVANGDISLIRSLIENENVNGYVRDAALRALVTLVACGETPREEVIAYFHELFNGRIIRKYSQVWNGLVSCSSDLYPEELYRDIEQCYEDDLVDSFFITIENVKDVLGQGKEHALDKLKNDRSYSLVTDTVRDMEWWTCFQPEKEFRRPTKLINQRLSKLLQGASIPAVQKVEPMRSQKIGRNQPCPCGSGKKYKKCCLRKDEENRLAVAQAGVADEIDVLDELSNSVLDLIRSGQLEEAEAVCQRLLTEYPDQVDGLDRLAMVYEAKGDRDKAAEYYRKAADFMRSHPGFDEEGVAWKLSEADRLDAEHEAGLDPSGPRCRG